MGFFDFLKPKKAKAESAAETAAEDVLSLSDADLSGVEPCETRYTQEYQDYLAEQEAAAAPPEESGEAPPC